MDVILRRLHSLPIEELTVGDQGERSFLKSHPMFHLRDTLHACKLWTAIHWTFSGYLLFVTERQSSSSRF